MEISTSNVTFQSIDQVSKGIFRSFFPSEVLHFGTLVRKAPFLLLKLRECTEVGWTMRCSYFIRTNRWSCVIQPNEASCLSAISIDFEKCSRQHLKATYKIVDKLFNKNRWCKQPAYLFKALITTRGPMVSRYTQERSVDTLSGELTFYMKVASPDEDKKGITMSIPFLPGLIEKFTKKEKDLSDSEPFDYVRVGSIELEAAESVLDDNGDIVPFRTTVPDLQPSA